MKTLDSNSLQTRPWIIAQCSETPIHSNSPARIANMWWPCDWRAAGRASSKHDSPGCPILKPYTLLSRTKAWQCKGVGALPLGLATASSHHTLPTLRSIHPQRTNTLSLMDECVSETVTAPKPTIIYWGHRLHFMQSNVDHRPVQNQPVEYNSWNPILTNQFLVFYLFWIISRINRIFIYRIQKLLSMNVIWWLRIHTLTNSFNLRLRKAFTLKLYLWMFEWLVWMKWSLRILYKQSIEPWPNHWNIHKNEFSILHCLFIGRIKICKGHNIL